MCFNLTQKPLATPYKQKVEFFNECMVLLIIYHLICFSDFLTRADSRTKMGYSIIFWTLLVFITNFVLVFNIIIR